MSPRPRKVSDPAILAAASKVMQRLGPRELTLAEIAAEAGLTAGALVQRFGSKRELLLALAEGAAKSSRDFIGQLRKTHPSPLAALDAYVDCVADLAASPAALARNLAYLQIDLTDPDFRRHLLAQARTTRAAMRSLVQAAIDARELRRSTDAACLARSIETVLSGSLITWAMYRERTAAAWMRDDLRAVLAPFVRRKASRRHPDGQ